MIFKKTIAEGLEALDSTTSILTCSGITEKIFQDDIGQVQELGVQGLL